MSVETASTTGTGHGRSPSLFLKRLANVLVTVALTFLGLTAITFVMIPLTGS